MHSAQNVFLRDNLTMIFAVPGRDILDKGKTVDETWGLKI